MTNAAADHGARSAHILAVEDNPEMLLLIEHFLDGNYELTAAMDEDSALSLAAERPFDVVLIDINLGKSRTGIDVLQALRQLPGYANVPVAAVTAYALPGDRDHFLRAGFNTHLGKPFNKKRLLEAIQKMLTP